MTKPIEASSTTLIKPDQEYVMSAAIINLVNVAQRTGGKLIWETGSMPTVSWNQGRTSLGWKDMQSRGGTAEDTRRTLVLSHDGAEAADMEITGLVMGVNFVAFVHPRQEGMREEFLEADVISVSSKGANQVKRFSDPEEVFDPIFVQARDIAQRNLIAFQAAALRAKNSALNQEPALID